MAGELVLIVEDNEKNLKLVRDLLQFKGYRTLEAGTAEDGLALARANRPGLILMDIQLPGMDGVTALGRLKAEPSTAAIPVVALTASAMTDERERFLAAGFDGYLFKPIDVRAFPEQVRRYLDSGGREPDGPPPAAEPEAGAAMTADAAPDTRPTILVVDDTPHNIKLLDAVLTPRGYRVLPATSGREALEIVASEHPDLVLLDIVMPGMDGYEVCRRLRDSPATRLLPVVMITASGEQEKLKALEAGADDFIPKPFNQSELIARVTSLLRIKQYHDTIQAQAAELAEWNHTLEARVHQQVEELERVGRLKRFLSPQLAELIVSSGDETFLESHRREIAVVFCDLRGFTAFAETAEPEEVMGVLREYYAAMGTLTFRFEGTVEHFAGDGLMVFFNDPVPCPDPAARAVRMAVAMRERMGELTAIWRKRGHDLGFGVGIALGYATLGKVGFEGRFQYAAIGTVANLASRLCDEAKAGQILISRSVQATVEDLIRAEPLPEFTLKGFTRPVPAWNVLELTE